MVKTLVIPVMPVLETVLQQISTKTVFSERKLKETGLANLENPDKHVTCAHVTTSSCPMSMTLKGRVGFWHVSVSLE